MVPQRHPLDASPDASSNLVLLEKTDCNLCGADDFQVVYANYGQDYEVRMLQLGRRGPEYTEVLSGLEPGTPYVAKGSFLVRADIEKSGASHDH